MQLVLLRHGESEGNIAQVINDDPARPVPLTVRGEAQARAAGQQLSRPPFTRAYCSEFLRARQTAEWVLAGQSCPLRVDARLNERRSGMDGAHIDAFNDFVRADPVHSKPPQGECFIEQMQRVGALLDKLKQSHSADARILLVSHENPIQAMRAVLGLDPECAAREHLDNAAWYSLDL